jgi:hypothetical protein
MSSFAWLDFSESDRRNALDVIDLFREQGTVDELGIGTVRDGIADLLFPGTSTIMTRARYYLFVPWMYRKLEARKVASNQIAQVARKEELALVEVLAKSDDLNGVIGIQARSRLRRLPSTIYWAGLAQLGIRRNGTAIDGYHRSLDSFYALGGTVIRGDDGHAVSGGVRRNWDADLPPTPARFPAGVSLQLLPPEAVYLRECIAQSAPKSLFAFLVDLPSADGLDARFPWEHPRYASMSEKNRAELDHARNFSLAMYGAAMLYNLMLAEKKKDEVKLEEYSVAFSEWANEISQSRSNLNSWSRLEFWAMVHRTGARVTLPTERFINVWLDRALAPNSLAISSSKSARNLIVERERALKRGLARLDNPRALDLWGGASGRYRLDYRWNRPVTRILADMYNAVGS